MYLAGSEQLRILAEQNENKNNKSLRYIRDMYTELESVIWDRLGVH